MIARALLFLALLLPAVRVQAQEAATRFAAAGAAPAAELAIRSTTDIAIIAPALEAFVAARPDIAVTYEQWGSNALYADSLAACEGRGTPADAVISSGIHQMVDLVNRACASPYRSDLTARLPAERIWRDELWGITREAAVILYNTDAVPAEDAPRTRFALLDLLRRDPGLYRGAIATYDIEASGLGFLFAFMDSQQATTFGGLLEAFARVEAVATCCSAQIIEAVENGTYKIAYNVLGSYVESVPHTRLGVIYPEDYTLFLSRGYMIPRSAPHKAEAAALLDFLLSPEGRAILSRASLIDPNTPDDTGIKESAQRYIPIDPTLLVAMDRQRRKSFVAQWRDTFGDGAR